jgi:glycerol-3-phosphate acyltransferase PlsY
MSEILWVFVAFISGSLPLSVWLGQIVLEKDITNYGDHNPGAANVSRAGGHGWGLFAVLLDAFKGLIPVALANFVFGFDGMALAAIAIAPIAGHAFSPFLGFKGGKAIAVSFGIWTGLTLWIVPTVFGVFLGIYLALIKPDGWAVAFGAISLLIVLLIIGNPVWLVVWAGMALIMGWKQRSELTQKPSLKIGRRNH